ncbi:MAG: hypothetical protein IKA73_03290 [Alphaproteobacteria bacterium]|nr:hypothetical protein [Alphaproteobacteria bacterium]
MKKVQQKSAKQTYTVVHSPKQRLLGILGFVALFVCGVMVGWGINSGRAPEHVKSAQAAEAVQPAAVPEQMEPTCAVIEEVLTEQLPVADADADNRIMRAKIFANLSERGCAENSQKYVAMAKQELEIARALEDDEFDQGETIEVVETYKRLNMQAAAEEIFETAKKLTNPAIDFILEVEKIINEK